MPPKTAHDIAVLLAKRRMGAASDVRVTVESGGATCDLQLLDCMTGNRAKVRLVGHGTVPKAGEPLTARQLQEFQVTRLVGPDGAETPAERPDAAVSEVLIALASPRRQIADETPLSWDWRTLPEDIVTAVEARMCGAAFQAKIEMRGLSWTVHFSPYQSFPQSSSVRVRCVGRAVIIEVPERICCKAKNMPCAVQVAGALSVLLIEAYTNPMAGFDAVQGDIGILSSVFH